ncbi:acetyltransferase [Ensifer sp. Root31]|uniref:GNAT family N-acetyltransferase n=1 Tax=Ensifer sp. Root31 TaxID=1736512 RepID=UPI00070D3410|nr:GNAT family N-acetyltransferase [Ensifer sp. Root31]KQU83873.1 acetyltransferase [Ensifer sp. Root31]
MFSQSILDFWRDTYSEGDLLFADDAFSVMVNPDLDGDEGGTILETLDGKVRATIRPELAEKLNFDPKQGWSAGAFRDQVTEAGASFHGADLLFYFSTDELMELSHQTVSSNLRRLTRDDGPLFARFCSGASEEDLDAAYVELDHWVVFGAFEKGELVCAASMYPWMDSKIADLGVLTLVPFRGRGHGRATVRAICKFAVAEGYLPQYRCQLDNQASVAAARAVGLNLFGQWDVILSEAKT